MKSLFFTTLLIFVSIKLLTAILWGGVGERGALTTKINLKSTYNVIDKAPIPKYWLYEVCKTFVNTSPAFYSKRKFLTLRPLLSKDGGLAELGEEVVVDGSVFVKVEIDQSKAGLVDGLLEGVRASADRWPGQRKSGRPVSVSGDHEKPELADSAEVTSHFDNGPENIKYI